MFRSKPSPSMVVALVALFVALSGVAVAGVTLSNNTIRSNHIVNGQVKRADIANSAVNSAKVADGSLGAADLSAAAQAALRGNTGPAGPSGATGPTGATGPSDAFAAFHDADINIPLAQTILLSLNVPAGKYAIFAKGQFAISSTNAVPTCNLVAAGDFDTTNGFLLNVTQYSIPFALNVVHEFPAAGTIHLSCANGTGTATTRINTVKITAIRVGSLSNVAI